LTVPVIGANPNPVCAGQPVQFSGPGAPAITWLWNFGDLSTNGGQNPSHAYLTAGPYTVSLTATDAEGCTKTNTLNITVNPAPLPDTIQHGPLRVCAGTSVTLTAPTGAGYLYNWSTGATTQAIATLVSGTFTVTVTNANGCTMVPDSVTVTVLPAPTAAISGNLFVCDAGCTTLTASPGLGYTYQWLNHRSRRRKPDRC
jgi:hypothetical protein